MTIDAASDLLKAGVDAQRRGDRSGAWTAFIAVIESGEEQPFALNALGNMVLVDGDAQIAAGYFKRAIAVDSRAPELWNNLAKAYRLLADDAAEKKALDGALAIDQRNFMALLRMAELHERRGELPQAERNWRAVIALAPPDETCPPALLPLIGRARSFLAERMQAFEEAISQPLDMARANVSPGARRRFDVCVDVALGRRRVYTNQCHGLYYPFMPVDEFFSRGQFPWFVKLEKATSSIRTELSNILTESSDNLRPYVRQESGTPRNLWSELDNNLQWSAYFLWKHGVRDDVACRRCPQTAKIIESLPRSDISGRSPTVFFSILRPQTRIPAHTGVTNTRAIVHLPLIVPPGCGFRVGGETREWHVGEAFAFDDTIEHEAWNDSDELRAVLIFDVWNPHLTDEERSLLRTFYEASDASGHNPAMAQLV